MTMRIANDWTDDQLTTDSFQGLLNISKTMWTSSLWRPRQHSGDGIPRIPVFPSEWPINPCAHFPSQTK